MSGPCAPWVTSDEVADCCDSFEGGTDTSELEPWVGPAVEALFALSGGRFTGLCGPRTERPCGNCGFCGVQRWRYTDGRLGVVPTWGGDMWSWPVGGPADCGCGCVPEVWLGRSDVQGIEQVKIDGAVVPPLSYRLDRRSYLVRVDGQQWPNCQAVELDDSQPGTFSVSFWYGEEPTDLAVSAAAALACQLWAACNNAGRCKLPKGTQTVVRGSTVIQLGGLLAESLKKGSTGILAIDTFITAYGGDDGGTSTVWSPDLPNPRRVG